MLIIYKEQNKKLVFHIFTNFPMIIYECVRKRKKKNKKRKWGNSIVFRVEFTALREHKKGRLLNILVNKVDLHYLRKVVYINT